MHLFFKSILMLAVVAIGIVSLPVQAKDKDFGIGQFPQQDGESIFKTVCQGCHMPDGTGAIGAGRYPALAGNLKLKTAVYPILVVVNGQKAMPSFGASLDDTQVANIVNYIRSHLGNSYRDTVTAENVKSVRAARPIEATPV